VDEKPLEYFILEGRGIIDDRDVKVRKGTAQEGCSRWQSSLKPRRRLE